MSHYVQALIAPFASMSKMAREAFPPIRLALALMPWLVRDKFDNLAKAPQLTIPTLVLHGSHDEVVPQKQVSLYTRSLLALY